MANWLTRTMTAALTPAPPPMPVEPVEAVASRPVAAVRAHGSARVPSITRMQSTASRMDRATVSGFDIGKTGRRLAAIPAYTTALNTVIQQYGASAVARSRYLAQNNPYTVAAREAWVSAMAGTGIKPSMLTVNAARKTAISELWNDWIQESDYDEVQDHYGQQAQVAGELFEAGEAFAIFEDEETDDGLPPLKIRLIPAEQCPYQNITAAKVAPGNNLYMGIEFTPAGKRVAYHFLKRPPGEYRADARSLTADFVERIPADRVMHVFRPVRPGQVRGIPVVLSGMVTLAMTDLYDDAELERKRTAALFAAFVKKAEGAEEGDSPLGDLVTNPSNGAANSYPLEPGTVVGMEPGEEIQFSEPADVGGNYEAFQYRSLLKAAAGFGVPYSSFTGDLKAVNYSSIRAGLVEFRRRAAAIQHNVMVFQFCRKVWRRFLDVSTITGVAPWGAAEYLAAVREFRRVKFLPPKWDWVDPKKDIEAEVIAVNNGFKSRSDVIEEGGEDPEAVDARIAADKKRADDLGLKFGDAAKAAPGQNPAEDSDEDNPENPDDNGGSNAQNLA